MTLDRIRLTCFRNHHETLLAGTRHFNLLTGENGAGKTNVLEAISLFAPGRGLRRASLPEMAAQKGDTQKGDGSFAVSADLSWPDAEPLRLGTGISAERPGRRLVKVNGAEASAVSLGQWLGIFWLTPAMDRLFTDAPSARRRFLDRLVLTLLPAHAARAARYEAALRERNRLLALPHEPDSAWLDAIEIQMAEAGAAVGIARARLVERLDDALSALPETPFARPVLTLNSTSPHHREGLAEALAASRSRDRAAGRSLTGPHRDDLLVTMAAKNQPAATCSTGEQKAMLIAIVLAHSDMSEETPASSRPRVLLLDEVAAHLDPLRRAALFERLATAPAQIWMTGTEPAPFAPLAGKAAHWLVDHGAVSEAGW